MKFIYILWLSVLSSLIFSCNESSVNITNNETNEDIAEENINPEPSINFKLLSLGDSYTIGESVCESCRFPAQLKDSLQNNIDNSSFELQIIAQTGWTTTNLINAISNENLESNFDLVTLLIGVNNQYQSKPFSVYEIEFPQLVETAIELAKGDKDKVIVVSIPDYAFTPFGNGNNAISIEINQYNSFAQGYCNYRDITFVNITDITRQGLQNPSLVANDNLHPSELAYTKFVERILPKALDKLD